MATMMTWDGKSLTVVPQLWLDRLDKKEDQVKVYPSIVTELHGASFNKNRIYALAVTGDNTQLMKDTIFALIKSNYHYSTIKPALQLVTQTHKGSWCTVMMLTEGACYKLDLTHTGRVLTTNVTEKIVIAAEDTRPFKHIFLRQGNGVLATAYALQQLKRTDEMRIVLRVDNGELKQDYYGSIGPSERLHLAWLKLKSRFISPMREFAV